MKEFSKTRINDGVELICARTNRFKTNELSISFVVPLKEETAAANALLAFLVSQTTKEYPTLAEFNKKLAMLYGASIHTFITKLGENQCITLEASCLDDRFSIDGENISTEVFDFLCKLIFEVKLDEKGNFFEEDIQREKRLLIERIESEENDKRIFALRRLEEIMFEDEPYGINRYGSRKGISSVNSDMLKKALEYLINCAKIQITVVGNSESEKIAEIANKYFGSLKRSYAPPACSVFIPQAKEIKSATDRMEVKQGKLVLGFRVNNQSEFKSNPEMRLFSDIFGGGPYSKLFNNVREKLSLCYYCSARYDRRKSTVIIQCGCEEENMQKAVDEILAQLEDIKQGNVEEELEAGKMAISDAINSVNDDSISLLSWYANQICDEEILTPAQSSDENRRVTREDICRCAGLLSLDTVYKLVSKKEGE